MSNNIYDILKKIESLEAPKKTNLTESKSMTTVKELHNESKKEKQANKGSIAEAVATVEKQLNEKYMGFKKKLGEAQVNELSPDTLTSYADKAKGQRGWAFGRAKAGKEGHGSADPQGKFDRLWNKRADGYNQAVAKGARDLDKSGQKSSWDWSKDDTPAALKRDKGMAEGAVEESGLQAYLGKKKYGKEGMSALQKAGRDGASKEKMAQIRAKHDKMDEGIMDTVKGYARKAGRAIAGEWNPTVYARNHFEDWIDSNPGLASHKEGLMSLYDRAAEYRLGIDNADRGETVLKVYKQIQKGQTDNLPVWATAPATNSRPEGSYQRKLAGVLPVDEGSYNEEMLSPKQKSFAALAEPKDKITYADKIAGAKKGKKTEGNKFSGNLMKARAQGLKQADLDGDGDMEPVRGGKKMGEAVGLDPNLKSPNSDRASKFVHADYARTGKYEPDVGTIGAWQKDVEGQQKYKSRTEPGIINKVKDTFGLDKPDPAYGPKDPTPMKEGRKSMREGWEEMQKYLDKKRGPESKGGAGKKAGTRYGGSAQKDDDDEETDGEGKPVEKKKGRPKGTGGGAKFSFKKPKD